MNVPDELKVILDRIANHEQSDADIAVLREWLSSDGQIVTQTGKYAVNLGEGQDVHVGDRTYQGADAEAIREIVRSILQELQGSAQLSFIKQQYRGSADILPHIQDANVLRGEVGSGYAIEILVENPSNEEILLRKATIGSLVPYRVHYAAPPPVYVYEVNLEVDSSPTTSPEIFLSGLAKEPNDPFGRPASGLMVIDPFFTGFEVSFPLYLMISPKATDLIRFTFGKPRTMLNCRFCRFRDKKKHEEFLQRLGSSLKQQSTDDIIGTWIVLEGNTEQPLTMKVDDSSIFLVFKGLGIETLEWRLRDRE